VWRWRRLVNERRALWVLDEPYVALDTAAVELVAGLIGAHLQRGGLAVLTTHQDGRDCRGHGARTAAELEVRAY
jgi:ABC-type transport system involved in cytochrome c biogenesis ATPase subunit